MMSFFFVCLLYNSISLMAQTTSSGTITVESLGSGEINSLHLDNLVFELRRSVAERLFVIARLGDGETFRRLNLARLDGARLYLVESGRIPKERIVFAEGERVKGEGRVEFYLGSRLYLVSLAGRGKNINFTCCGDYIPLSRGKRKKRR
ncbi:MAG: hypothetical protein ICV60_17100 [Pyrinomonadaceae bacterium]|nr:hypothetical protein [Pyrinomonadaceae bacterium]